MSHKIPRLPKSQTTTTNSTDRRQQNEGKKQPLKQKNTDNSGNSPQSPSTTSKTVKNAGLGNKKPLPPISTSRSHFDDAYDDVDNNEQDFELNTEASLPLKLFDGKKQSLNELSEESMSYIWLRRIKEIFLHMADGKDEQDDDPFVEFDMNLARTDLINTCDRYIENERLALNKKDTKTKTSTKTGQQNSSLQNVQDYIKELNDLIKDPSSGDLSSLLTKYISSLQELDKTTQDTINKLRKQQTNTAQADTQTILESIRSLEMIEKKKEKTELEKKQEWDMKKLYAEVFKMSYRRNPLRTEDEIDDLTPKKKGDDQPNFGNAIWWYSCDKANIYYQINSILRLENFELLMSYRYYLSDLCRMIEFMYEKRKEEHGDIPQKFYRAGHVSKSQLSKMEKQQKGQFISLVGFISTTTNIEIAKGYARKQQISKDNERALFQISIKPQEPCTAFAYIEDISFHPEEKEVLFSMGSTFLVDRIEKPKKGENYHTIHLTATEIDKLLLDDIRTKIENCSPSGRAVLLAQYLVELGEYRAARKYLGSLLNQACDGGLLVNDPSLASIYSCLGMTYARQNLHGDAIKAFKQALNTQARLEYSNNNMLADIHNNIGLAYVGLGHSDEAEKMFSEAIQIQLRELNSNQQHLAPIYSNIGSVHYKKKNFTEAEEAFSQAEKIYKKSSSKIAHDALEQSLIKAEYLTNYGHLLCVHKPLEEAQKRYNEALKLYKSILLDSDPKLMQTHINIMLAYAQNKKYDELTKWYEDLSKEKIIEKQEINMFELNSSVTQANLAFLHKLVGACYAKQKSFNKSIEFWTRAFIFKRKARLEQLLFETTNSISSNIIDEQIDFINKSYRVARKYYMEPNNQTNESNNNTDTHLSNDFCLGFLDAELDKREKAIEHLEIALQTLEQSNKDALFVTHLILADMYKYQQKHQEAITFFDSALTLLKSLDTQKDRVLEIEIKLARSDCVPDTEIYDAIRQLEILGRSLKSNDTDTKRISLKVIVYDTLAQYYLKKKNYDLFDNIVEISTTLKLRSFSQYHPSLAINLNLIAERLIQQDRYREALDFYEYAFEIQNLNLTYNHPKIKKICYAIGDTYCKLDKVDHAKEKYNAAENIDDADILEEDNIYSEEPIEIFMARISMHQHLAEYYRRKQLYKEAILEMEKNLDLLKEKLPMSAFDINDETALIKKKCKPSLLPTHIEQLADCYLRLGDIMKFDQEDENGYRAAYEIYWKLFQDDDEESVKVKLLLANRKLSDYYDALDEIEEALQVLQDAADIEQPTIFTLYRLAYLNIECGKLDEAIANYVTILKDSTMQEQKTIVEEKLAEVKKKLEEQHQKRRLSTSSESDNSSSSTSSVNASHQLSRNVSHISAAPHGEEEIEHDTNIENRNVSTDYRAKAAAYSQLGNLDKAIKFYEKDIKERPKNIKDSNIFEKQLKTIEQTAYMYGQQAILIVLPKLFHSLVKQIRETNTFEQTDIRELADSFFQCALLYDQLSDHVDSVCNYISALGIYVAKSTSDVEGLIGDINRLLNLFIDFNLKSENVIGISKRYLSPNDFNQLYLKIAAMYRDNEMDDVEDTDGDGNTSNESREIALKWYRDLLNTTSDVLIKGSCYYNILVLYKDFIYEDDIGKNMVVSMIPLLEKFTTSDQRLLITLASDFLKEYDNNKGSCDIKTNRQLQGVATKCLNKELKVNDEANIGKCLMECNDQNSAEKYWKSIIEQLEAEIPNRILTLLHDPYSTFGQIFDIIEEPDNETTELFQHLTKTYETLGDFYALDAKNEQTTDASAKCFQQAEVNYKMAVHLLKRLPKDAKQMNEVEQKQQALTLQRKKT